MNHTTIIAVLGCLAGLVHAQEEGPLQFNVPVYFDADKNMFVEQLVDVDYQKPADPGTALIFGNVKTKSRLLIGTNSRHFSVSMSPDAPDLRYMMVSNNYASRENTATIYTRMTDYPYLDVVMRTPGNQDAREQWEVDEWRVGESSALLKKSTEGKEDSYETVLLNQCVPHAVDKCPESGEQIILDNRLFYQLIPELDADGQPTGKKYLLVSRVDNTWGIVFNNFPLNLTIKYGKKGDVFSIIDTQSSDEELEFRRTKEYPFFECSRIKGAVPVEPRQDTHSD